MKRIYKRLVLGAVASLAILMIAAPGAMAYDRYKDAAETPGSNCSACHGDFTDATSTKGAIFPGDDKHNMHRSVMGAACNLCHAKGDDRNPWIGTSDGTSDNPGLGCNGCHDGVGLRAHHTWAGVTECAACHPGDPVPPSEDTMPVYYGTADTLADNPCNPIAQANINENWTVSDFLGLDNDGDGLYDTNDPDCIDLPACPDIDMDMYAVCDASCDATGLMCGDCDDNNAAVNPGASELCNGIDDNCDTQIDETFPDLGMSCTVGIGECAATGVYVCTFDGLGTECNAVPGTPGIEGPAGDPTCSDTLDNDCDNQIDDLDPDCTGCTDNDGDGVGIDDGICTAPFDCDDNDPNNFPGNTEICDGQDNNCDGQIDEGLIVTWYEDADGDMYGNPMVMIDDCAQPPGYVTDNTDCNDADPNVNPAATEICNGIDDNCDLQIDETFPDLGMSCSAGVGECQADGVYVCTPDGLATECDAVPGTPGIEGPEGDATCSDGVDNDCDGDTDGLDTDCGASVKPPPVNQNLGILDTRFNNLIEDDCRGCHNQNPPPEYPVDPTYLPDRHHLLVDTAIQPDSDVPNPDANGDGVPDTLFECLSCHNLVWNPVAMTFDLDPNFRDCTVCHVQDGTETTVHHAKAEAQTGDCIYCHGFIDDQFDGHYIPTYQASLVTPYPSKKPNADVNGEGNCNFCHDAGLTVLDEVIFNNQATHHGTGLNVEPKCTWCHGDFTGLPIRNCENCHGIGSLHNIQTTEDGRIGEAVIPGAENPYYGHIGSQTDCWGCHGNNGQILTAAPGSGPVMPALHQLTVSKVQAGSDTVITLKGEAFINLVENPATGEYDITLYSDVQLTDVNGNKTVLQPNSITGDTISVTVPGDMAAGSYKIAALKGTKRSNPMNLVIAPVVSVDSAVCVDNTLTIDGSGFGGYLAAADSGTGVSMEVTVTIGKGKDKTTTTVVEDGVVQSWNNTRIVADFSGCGSTVEVSTVFGSTTAAVTSSDGGKPPKEK